MATVSTPKRPGIVTFIGVIIFIQAVLAALVAVATLVNQNDAAFQASTGQTADQLLTIGIAEAIVGLILLAVAMTLMSGSRGARTLVAIVMTIRIAVAAWALLTHHAGGVFGVSTITIVVSLFVLWALYGHDASEEYFG